jgi:hypothetical protein
LLTEVVAFDPVGRGKSSFGHTAINLNGTVYSFGEKGWFSEPFDKYMERNKFRSSTGQVLDYSSEQEKLLEVFIKQDIKKNPKWTSNNNCSTKAYNMLNDALYGAFDRYPVPVFPDELRKLLEKAKVVNDNKYYPKKEKEN